MIAIIDYGVGNLFSLSASLNHLGLESAVTDDPELIDRAEKVILPGVGAFGDAAAKLRGRGLEPVLGRQVAAKKPLLGICLGMQLLFERSSEYGEHLGLGYIKGSVRSLAEDLEGFAAEGEARGQGWPALKVPHMGWSALRFIRPEDPLLKYIKEGDYVYYVHSFYGKDCGESLVAVSDYGVTVPGVVRQGNVWGCQFHPEKSGDVGLRILKAFGELAWAGPEGGELGASGPARLTGYGQEIQDGALGE